jgi:dual oxidase
VKFEELMIVEKNVLLYIGMGADSKDFAGELYEALARRRNINAENGITLNQVRVFWEDMTTKDLESRLQVFFDM